MLTHLTFEVRHVFVIGTVWEHTGFFDGSPSPPSHPCEGRPRWRSRAPDATEETTPFTSPATPMSMPCPQIAWQSAQRRRPAALAGCPPSSAPVPLLHAGPIISVIARCILGPHEYFPRAYRWWFMPSERRSRPRQNTIRLVVFRNQDAKACKQHRSRISRQAHYHESPHQKLRRSSFGDKPWLDTLYVLICPPRFRCQDMVAPSVTKFELPPAACGKLPRPHTAKQHAPAVR